MSDEGWKQIRAGLVLIQWSHLALWDVKRCVFIAAEPEDFEDAASRVHHEFGRVISWILFSVGSEYLLKGVCLIRGLIVAKKIPVVRVPRPGEDVQSWAKMVVAKNASADEEVDSYGTMGSLPLGKLFKNLPDNDETRASFELLRQSIRNRDAHYYVRNVRTAQFHAIPDHFVPALNALLGLLNSDEIRMRVQIQASDTGNSRS